ncbi:MAG: hypothetical protein ABF289_05375 [Clostridiales bacterium]
MDTKSKQRKNIMIEIEKWNTLKIIADMGKSKNISSIISTAIDKYINEEFNNNLAFKLKMIAMDEYVSDEEEKEILNELNSLSDNDLRIVGKLKV